MRESTCLTQSGCDLVVAAPLVHWETALRTFLHTLSSPRTGTAYSRAVRQAMSSMDIDYVAHLDPPMLAAYRTTLVARLDVDRGDRLSPSTVSLTLAALRSFLNFCRLTSTTALSKDVIAFVLNTPRSQVEKPYEVLSEAERRQFLGAAQGPREKALVSLALGAGLRVSELVSVRVGDFSQDEAGGWSLGVRTCRGQKNSHNSRSVVLRRRHTWATWQD